MSLQYNLRGEIRKDWQYVDGLETVTYTQTSTGTTYEDVKAIANAVEARETGDTLAVARLIKVWIMFADTLEVEPKPGDTITDEAGDVWTVSPAFVDSWRWSHYHEAFTFGPECITYLVYTVKQVPTA